MQVAEASPYFLSQANVERWAPRTAQLQGWSETPPHAEIRMAELALRPCLNARFSIRQPSVQGRKRQFLQPLLLVARPDQL